MSVSKNQRRLVFVNSLSKHSSGIWKTVYQVGEWSGYGITNACLADDYAQIHACSGTSATKNKFLTRLKTAATKPGVKAVDVFLQTHGGDGECIFYDGAVTAANLRDEILALNLPNRLRLFYNLACFGDSQNWKEMLDAGFATTVGAKRVACTAAAEFPIFCNLWQLDMEIKDVITAADNPLTRAALDGAVKILKPNWEINSKKVIRGKKDLKISSSV